MKPLATEATRLPRTEVRQRDQNQASRLQQLERDRQVLEWLDDVFEGMVEDHGFVAAFTRRRGRERPLLGLDAALPRLGDCLGRWLDPGHAPAKATEDDAEVAAPAANVEQASRCSRRQQAEWLGRKGAPVATFEQCRREPAKHRVRR